MTSEEQQIPPPETAPGLPGVRSWRAVYLVVFGTFLLWIVLLTILTRFYS